MLEFQLFRIMVHPPKQKSLFRVPETRQEILTDMIDSKPSAELKKGMTWHVGNISKLDEHGVYFRVGRTSTSKIEVYQNGNFVDEEFETAPYTHVILDLPLQVCAIARKAKLSPTALGIARQLLRLFNQSSLAQSLQARFEIGEINDPEDFISHIQGAYRISKFWVTFSKPNAFDVDKDFIRPMENLLKESQGDKGKTELKGQSLRPDTLEDLTRSAATTGDEAGAWLQPQESQPPLKKRLKGNPAILAQEDVSDIEKTKKLLDRIRNEYERIRSKAKGDSRAQEES